MKSLKTHRECSSSLIRADARGLCSPPPHNSARDFLPISGFGNRLDGISHMIGIETGKDSIPVLRIDAIVALAQFRQMGLSIDDKAASLITAIRCLQHKEITLSTVMHQLPCNKRCAVVLHQPVNWAVTSGQHQNCQ